MEERYKTADTVPGTRSFRQFIPISDSIIGAKCFRWSVLCRSGAKYVSDYQYYAVQFDFSIVHLLGPGDTFSFSVCCMFVYRQYWLNYNGSFNWEFGCEGQIYASQTSNTIIKMAELWWFMLNT